MIKNLLLILLCFFTILPLGLHAGSHEISNEDSSSKPTKADPPNGGQVKLDNGAIIAPPVISSSDSLIRVANANFLNNLDKALEPNIAATLAGLALAALALLLSLVSAHEQRKMQTQSMPIGLIITQELKDKEIASEDAKLETLNNAVKNLKISFYCFVGFLCETLTVDVWEERTDFLNIGSFAEIAEVSISAGLLAFGIVFITKGATKMASVI